MGTDIYLRGNGPSSVKPSTSVSEIMMMSDS